MRWKTDTWTNDWYVSIWVSYKDKGDVELERIDDIFKEMRIVTDIKSYYGDTFFERELILSIDGKTTKSLKNKFISFVSKLRKEGLITVEHVTLKCYQLGLEGGGFTYSKNYKRKEKAYYSEAVGEYTSTKERKMKYRAEEECMKVFASIIQLVASASLIPLIPEHSLYVISIISLFIATTSILMISSNELAYNESELFKVFMLRWKKPKIKKGGKKR